MSMSKLFLFRRLTHLIHYPKDTACGPANNFVHVCIKYGIHMHLSNALESGSYCSIAQWKKLANI